MASSVAERVRDLRGAARLPGFARRPGAQDVLDDRRLVDAAAVTADDDDDDDGFKDRRILRGLPAPPKPAYDRRHIPQGVPWCGSDKVHSVIPSPCYCFVSRLCLAWALDRARARTLALVADLPAGAMLRRAVPGERHPAWLLGHLLLADSYLSSLLAAQAMTDRDLAQPLPDALLAQDARVHAVPWTPATPRTDVS